jgi:anti-anti-sigma regulatory factor
MGRWNGSSFPPGLDQDLTTDSLSHLSQNDFVGRPQIQATVAVVFSTSDGSAASIGETERNTMQMTVTSLKCCDLVTLTGQIYSATAPVLEAQLLELVDIGKGRLALDFSDVTTLSSVGPKATLHAQIRIHKKSSQGQVALATVPPHMRETFELLGLHHTFDM